MDKIVHFLIIFKDAAVYVGRWIEMHSNFVTAAATITIAAFTLTLWMATRKLWKVSQEQSRHMETSIAVSKTVADAAQKSAEAAIKTVETMQDIAERQLRAYVIIDTITIENIVENQHPTITIELKNAGQTPAYDLMFWFKIDSSEYPHPSIFNNIEARISNELKNTFPSKAIVGQGQVKATNQTTGNPISTEFIKQMNAGTHAIYAYGMITYKDIFSKERRTVFRHYRNIKTPGQGNRMTVCNEGNEAD